MDYKNAFEINLLQSAFYYKALFLLHSVHMVQAISYKNATYDDKYLTESTLKNTIWYIQNQVA